MTEEQQEIKESNPKGGLFVTPQDMDRISAFAELIDVDSMNWLEALFFSILTGSSFTQISWSKESQDRLQYYVIGNRLILQDGKSSYKPQDKLPHDRKYCIYTGLIESLRSTINDKLERIYEIKRELGSNLNLAEELMQLHKELEEYNTL